MLKSLTYIKRLLGVDGFDEVTEELHSVSRRQHQVSRMRPGHLKRKPRISGNRQIHTGKHCKGKSYPIYKHRAVQS